MLLRRWLPLLPLVIAGCNPETRLATECEGGKPGACDVLSARYAYGEGVASDPARAKSYRDRTELLCAEDLDAGKKASATCERFAVAVKAVPLDLPRHGDELQAVMSVVVAADGSTQIDGKALANDDAILPIARAAHDVNPELRVVIKADANVSHGRVIHVLDLLKQAQVSKIAFGVSPIAPPVAP